MIVAWDIRSTMREIDSEIVLQKARETYPEARPRIITDQGSQFKSREFKSFIAQWQASHVMTSPYYPQSNGKIERFHQTLKDHAIRPLTPLDLDDAKRITGDFIEYYNTTRLHSAIGFIAPKDRLEGRQCAIHKARDKKLDEARKRRKIAHQKLTLNTNRNQPLTIPAVA
jgi:transposase InsO family protein